VPPGFDGPVVDEEQALTEAIAKAQLASDSVVAAALQSADGGLVVQPRVLGAGLVQQLRHEALACRRAGWLRSNGQESQGRTDSVCFLSEAEAVSAEPAPMNAGLPSNLPLGLAFGVMLLKAICRELSKYWVKKGLRPSAVQLSCYDGGASYRQHRDGYESSDLGEGSIPEGAFAEIERRYITAVLYLQDAWPSTWGGAFRAHASSADLGLDKAYVDVMPGRGSLLLFRARDLPHEVLATHRPRYALSMWLLETEKASQ